MKLKILLTDGFPQKTIWHSEVVFLLTITKCWGLPRSFQKHLFSECNKDKNINKSEALKEKGRINKHLKVLNNIVYKLIAKLHAYIHFKTWL